MATAEFDRLKAEIDSIFLDLAALDTTPMAFMNTRRALFARLREAIDRLEKYAQEKERTGRIASPL